MPIPSPLKKYHFHAILIWWHSPFNPFYGTLMQKEFNKIDKDFPGGCSFIHFRWQNTVDHFSFYKIYRKFDWLKN